MNDGLKRARVPRVLVVEDNPGDLRLVEEGVRGADLDLDLHVQHNGSQAIEWLIGDGDRSDAEGPVRSGSSEGLLRGETLDLVLLDLNVPGKSGFDVLRAMRDERRFDDVPVVVVSSSEDPSDVRQAYEDSANAYVTKPTDPDEYIRMIRAAIEFWIGSGSPTRTND